MTSAPSRPKFARIWRGRTIRAKADEYQRYLLQNGIAPLQAKGALDVEMLREDRETETEFVTISYWESVEAMTGGTSDDPRQAHHLGRDAEFLIELPHAVQILCVLDT
jgi:heme-degrading monooxygenase HmoA